MNRFHDRIAKAEPYGEDIDRESSGFPRNDTGNAQRFMLRHGRHFRHVPELGWLHWTGKVWAREGADEAVMRAAVETAEAIREEAKVLQKEADEAEEAGSRSGESDKDFSQRLAMLAGRVETHIKWARTSGDAGRLGAMTRVAGAYLTVQTRELDANPFLLNLVNGTLVLQGDCMELRPHNPEDLLTKMMPVEFNPAAACPTFQRFLADVVPDTAVQLFLQRWDGYGLTGVASEQVFVFFWGTGQNGKSTYVDLLGKMRGDYATTIDIASLLMNDRKRGADASPDLARLLNTRSVSANEPEQNMRLGEAQIKKLTSQEPFPVRHLNRDFFDLTPIFKLTISGNHKPVIRGQDKGIWRRVLLVPWTYTVPDDKRDPDLPKKLWEERSGILNWMLDGCRLWLESRLEIPDAVRAATESYRADSDPLGRFLTECTEADPTDEVQASVLYEAFSTWCKANGERVWSNTAFGRAMVERGYERRDNGSRFYVGLRIVHRPTADRPPTPREEDYE